MKNINTIAKTVKPSGFAMPGHACSYGAVVGAWTAMDVTTVVVRDRQAVLATGDFPGTPVWRPPIS